MLTSKSPPTPPPIAVTRFFISADSNILSGLTFSTLRILPLMGRIAWNVLSRPCLAEPPAESPSTMYNSHLLGSLSEQSASFPGSALESKTLFLLAVSFALRAASLAVYASTLLLTIMSPTLGFSRRYSDNLDIMKLETAVCAMLLPSFDFVCPSNCGSGILMLTTAVSPSRISEPSNDIPLANDLSLAKSLKHFVNAVLNPARCVPPSGVLIVLTNETMLSE